MTNNDWPMSDKPKKTDEYLDHLDSLGIKVTRDKIDPYLPGKAPPPVSERTRCAFCSKPRRPDIFQTHDIARDKDGRVYSHFKDRQWTGHYRGYGHFCTMTCATKFANAAFNAGYRIRGKS